MDPITNRSDIRSKRLTASPSEVFAAMSDPDRLARWWGPAGFRNSIHRFEFHPGGTWLLTMHGPDGKDYPNESRFTRIEADKVFAIEHFEPPRVSRRLFSLSQAAFRISA
ncbi:MAG: SRPBCC domain-containing protein [Gammaproteobacteria bacterium]|nr:SRPBCC domain-containing protein [Gammaproteobacteria bacterium]